MFGHRLMSHPSRSAQESHISPTSPQMWIKAVYKGVDNSFTAVRFAGSVRLSPSVDRLWTNSATAVGIVSSRCAQAGGSCVRHRFTRRISTNTPRSTGGRSTARAHAPSSSSRWISGRVHSFPNTYDDYYLFPSLSSDNDYALLAVDRSRTLGVPGSVICPRTRPYPYARISVKGGHE